jgi:hypothetical protein
MTMQAMPDLDDHTRPVSTRKAFLLWVVGSVGGWLLVAVAVLAVI